MLPVNAQPGRRFLLVALPKDSHTRAAGTILIRVFLITDPLLTPTRRTRALVMDPTPDVA